MTYHYTQFSGYGDMLCIRLIVHGPIIKKVFCSASFPGNRY